MLQMNTAPPIHLDVGHDLHGLAEARKRSQREQRSDDGDDEALEQRCVLDAIHIVQTAGDLHSAQAQARGYAEDRGKHSQDIDGLADGPVNLFTQQRLERRADQERTIQAECEVTKGQAGNGEDDPRGDAPVEEHRLHGFVHGLVGQRVGARRSHEIGNGLCNAPEHQADAHAATEQLSEP